MDKTQLKIIQEQKLIVKINLKNGFFYTGSITNIGETSIVFTDKFGSEIPIDLDSISYVLPVKNGGNAR